MFPIKPTDTLAPDQLARYVRAIEPGGPPYLFKGFDQDARAIDLNDDCFSGATLFILFAQSLAEPAAESAARALAAAQLEAKGGTLIIATAETSARVNARERARLGLHCPVIADSNGAICATYGLLKNGRALSPSPLRLVAVSPYRRIRAFWDIDAMTNSARLAEAALDEIRRADAAAWTAPHPPVLIVPQVFDKNECVQLINEFESRGPLRIDRPKPGEEPEGYKIPTYEYGRQDRVDHVIADRALLAVLDQRLSERVFPMVQHAFAFAVTRREDLHIARYSGPRGGVEIGHRDNRTATLHRRFALSLNLNDDYDGGGVVFREFSNRPYKNAAGAALVFSSSLLHEVEETTKGVRYTLISHFFDDASLQQAKGR